MDCSYCILQAYFHPPVLQYFATTRNLVPELSHAFGRNRIWRMGTGEYTDSLIWEPVSSMPAFLVNTFARQTNSLLELKTKTVNVSSLLDLDHNGKTVLAWSVNTPGVIKTEERRTASLDQRLKTAALCAKKGYRLAFHFDPLVIYEGCEAEYAQVVRDIFSQVPPGQVVWISIGSFRFMPPLKPLVEQRFPHSTIAYGEFITGLDNKLRYFKPLRIRLYQALIREIRACAPEVLVYFCMEDPEVWEKCLGFFPGPEGALGALLDKSAVDHCNLNRSFL
jgi:spore photoproduct lyase